MNKRVETSQVDGFDVHFHANGIELNSMHLPACTAPWTPLESLQFAGQMMHFPIGESTNPPSFLGTYRWYVVFFKHIFNGLKQLQGHEKGSSEDLGGLVTLQLYQAWPQAGGDS
jgi:hypothetical protein